MWSILNITRVALMQVGVVIASILVGGVYHKWSSLAEMYMPPYENWWYQYGVFGFVFPIVWVVYAIHLYGKDEVSDPAKIFVFLLGIFAVVAMTVQIVSSILKLFMPDQF